MRQHLPRLDPDSGLFHAWDPMRWSPRAAVGRCRVWIAATRPRRVTAGVLINLLFLALIWPLSGSAAAGRSDTNTSSRSTSAIDGLAWTDIRDSSGIPLSNYLFATDSSILNPLETSIAVVLGLLFTIFMVVVISAIWLTGFVVSFRWLDWLSTPLNALADGLRNQIATPIMLAVAASIGAFFVAWFIVRGYHAKAVLQVVAMLVVAVTGVGYLAHPLAAVLSPNGLLAQGRDVGISVAAGLNGDSRPDPRSIVADLDTTLADNFARHPLQVWNFGHVIDDSPRCRTAWSSGILAGSEAQVTNGMRDCGDAFAHTKIMNPSLGQVGTGLILLIFGTILLLFMSYLSIKIFLAALSSIYHAILAIFGFAAGGFIYGPTQEFLVRNLVDTVGDALALVVYTTYLGCYTLVLDHVFRSAPDSGMAAIFVGGIVLIAGFILLRRLDLHLLGGQRGTAEKIRAALEGKPAPASGPSSGIGEASLRYSLSPGHVMGTALRDVAEFNANPLASFVFRRSSPLTHFSKRMQEMNYLNYELLRGTVPQGAAAGWMGRLTLGKNAHDAAARAAVRDFDGTHARAAAAAMTTILNLGADRADVMGALAVARFPREIRRWAAEAHARTMQSAEDNPMEYGPLKRVAAALDLAENSRQFGIVERNAHNAQFAESAAMFYRLTPRPVRNRSDANWETDPLIWDTVRRTYATFDDFQRVVTPERFAKADEDTRRYIAYRLSRDLAETAERYYHSPDEPNIRKEAMRRKNRAMYVDLRLAGTNIGPWTN
ncbi:hypothetical protein AB0L97_35870 [Nocardia sp. NPDC051911]|uniref:hypothetical protein n=1 Tax=Nocardia sp. NPDC051911 TaxID=3154648 RepID=UPI00343B5E45